MAHGDDLIRELKNGERVFHIEGTDGQPLCDAEWFFVNPETGQCNTCREMYNAKITDRKEHRY